jgi:hypothetical protein
MFRQKLLVWLGVGVMLLFSASTVWAATVFEEYFTGLTPLANITTSNTNFDYVRIGAGGGTITSQRTASGEDYMRLGGSSSGSLNGVGIQNSLGNLDVVTMNFRMSLESTDGTIFFGMGNGTMFTGDGGFNTSQLMWGIQINSGILQYRTSGWNNFSPSVTLAAGENYEFHIIANRSGADVTYNGGSNTVQSGRMDVYLDGTLIGNNVAITNNQNATGFRIYQINNELYARFDSITIQDEAVDPFTPTAATLQSLTAVTAASPIFLIVALLVGIAAAGTAVVVGRRTA